MRSEPRKSLPAPRGHSPRDVVVEILLPASTAKWQAIHDDCERMVHDRYHGRAEILNVYEVDQPTERDDD